MLSYSEHSCAHDHQNSREGLRRLLEYSARHQRQRRLSSVAPCVLAEHSRKHEKVAVANKIELFLGRITHKQMPRSNRPRHLLFHLLL